MVISPVATAFWVMLPTYVPNSAAVLVGDGRPIDGGRMRGGRRALGDGKTWRGTAVGTLAGTLFAVILNAAAPTASGTLDVSPPTFPLAAGFGLALGAMPGDISASFIKRRSGRERGTAFPGLNQLDLVVGALVFAFVAALGWFAATFFLPVLAVVLMMTPMLHVVTNVGAYLLGLKDKSW